MANTIVRVYDDYARAQKALNELLESGFSGTEVRLSPAEDSPDARQALLRSIEQPGDQADQGWSLGSFFLALFGADSRDAHMEIYAEAIRRGSYLLTVDAENSDQQGKATEIMDRHDPVDLDERTIALQKRRADQLR